MSIMLSALRFSIYRNMILKTNRTSILQYCSAVDKKKQIEVNSKYDIYALISHLKLNPILLNALVTFSNISKNDDIYEKLQKQAKFEVLDSLLRNSSCQEPMNVITTPGLLSCRIMAIYTKTENEDNLLDFTLKLSDYLLLYGFFRKCKASEMQKQMLCLLEDSMQELGKEIKNVAEVIFVYRNSSKFSKQTLSNVNENIQSNCSKFDAQDLANIIIALANAGLRNTSLLYTLTYYLFICQSELSPKKIVSVFCALATLNYQDKDLFEKLASNLADDINDVVSTTQINAMLSSLKLVRYKHVRLLEAISTWIAMNIDRYEVGNISTYLMALANLNYAPQNLDDTLKSCLHLIGKDIDRDIISHLKCVWSLVVLNRANKDIIGSILNKSVYDYLLNQTADHLTSFYCSKLLNINAAAKLMEGYDQELLPANIVNDILIRVEKNSVNSKKLESILPEILPPEAITYSVPTQFGVVVGAEFVLDSNGNALTSTDYKTNSANVPLPDGARRIAAMNWSFRDYCYDSQELTGEALLKIYLLQENGYPILEIPYFDIYDYNGKKTTTQSVRRKIKDL